MEPRQWLRTQWDRVIAWSLALVGAVLLIVGWVRVADTPYPAEQLPLIISGGIGGALLVVFGAALLISADVRDEWNKLDRIERILRVQTPDIDATVDPLPRDGDVAVPSAANPGASSNGVRSSPPGEPADASPAEPRTTTRRRSARGPVQSET